MILTHTDFDGVVSGALLSLAGKISFVRFLSNKQIWYENLTGSEIIADLPCPWKCRLWFDHHESNLKEMKERGIEPEKIPGRFQIADSCAQIIYDFYPPETFPAYFEGVVRETSIIDSMKYSSLEEWLGETPVKLLANTVQLFPDEDYRKFLQYLLSLLKFLKTTEPEKIIAVEPVKRRLQKYATYRNDSVQIIKNCYAFHKTDTEKKIAILDLTESKSPARIDKNFFYMIDPDADGVLLINSIFKNNLKTNDLKLSMGINFMKSGRLKNLNLARIFEDLGIGGGHPKTAGGIINASSKLDRLEKKEEITEKIIRQWYMQREKDPRVA